MKNNIFLAINLGMIYTYSRVITDKECGLFRMEELFDITKFDSYKEEK